MNKELLKRVLLDQLSAFSQKETGLEREINLNNALSSKQIVVITGIRRCGKSVLLRQIAEKLSDYYYCNFDDERLLNFKAGDFDDLMIIWNSMFQSKNIIIDEIQNVDYWEKFIRRIYDEGYKVFITGSNSKLLAGELSTHLTGRHIKIELFPFSLKEFLRFKNIKIEKSPSSRNLSELLKYSDYYIENGGFPEFLQYRDEEYLKRVYEDILYRDLIARFGIRDTKKFRELATFLFTNFTSEISYNSIQKMLNLRNVTSIKNHISYLQESYLVYELFRYDHSFKKQLVYNKKIYVIDNGLRNQVAFRTSSDSGRMLENMICVHLQRTGKNIYFYRGKKECDILIKEKNRIVSAIQVTDILTETNMERELTGLIEAMEVFNLKKGYIITGKNEDTIKTGKYSIGIIPAYKWLLDPENK